MDTAETVEQHPSGGTNPFKRIREQDDGLGDIVSAETAHTPEGESMTRQELAPEADINLLLARFGVEQQQRPLPTTSEIDYTMDLQQAHEAVRQAKQADYRVPDELRDKYPNWIAVLTGAETGEYQRDLAELQKRKATPPAKAPPPSEQTPKD